MSLRDGAETVVEQCLEVSGGEKVLLLNDSNDPELLDALMEVLDGNGASYEYMEYEEPENQGEEPPGNVAEAMKNVDVVIAPTTKSISHTEARREACEAGTRVVTMPGVTREVWNTSLQADYSRVKKLSDRLYSMLEDTDRVRITTPTGTDLELEVEIDYFISGTGMVNEEGDFGNLPAGEANGATVNASGTLVIDHFPYAPAGTRVEIEDNRVVAVEHPDGEESELGRKLEEMDCARNIAELGIGTNPRARLIGNVLQDEKVLGTVHIAFGDNSSYIPEGDERKVECGIHWDTVCESPTLWFDDRKVIDRGEPLFLDD